jgi:hypothetical protein
MIQYATDPRLAAAPKTPIQVPAKIVIPSPIAEAAMDTQPEQPPVASVKSTLEPLELSGDIVPKSPRLRSASPAKKRKDSVKPKAEASADRAPLLFDLEA